MIILEVTDELRERLCDIIEKLEYHYYDIRFALRAYRHLYLDEDPALAQMLIDFDETGHYNHRRVDQFYNEVTAYLDKEYG